MADQKTTPAPHPLQAFVEAALTNPRHPVFQAGLAKSAILQHYAVNVMMLETIKPEQWFKDYPAWTAKLEEVKRLCETPEPAEPDRLAGLEQKIADLTARLEQLAKTAEPPAAETPAE